VGNLLFSFCLKVLLFKAMFDLQGFQTSALESLDAAWSPLAAGSLAKVNG
jgi:hypothetical protein